MKQEFGGKTLSPPTSEEKNTSLAAPGLCITPIKVIKQSVEKIASHKGHSSPPHHLLASKF
jgi:hypothetical protein